MRRGLRRALVLVGLAGCAPQPPATGWPLPPSAPTPAGSLVFGWVPPAPVPPAVSAHPSPAPPPASLCFARFALFAAYEPLHACEQLQLRRAPGARGRLRIELSVGADGRVRRVGLEPDGVQLPADVLGCFTRASLSQPPLRMATVGDVPPDVVVTGRLTVEIPRVVHRGATTGHGPGYSASCWERRE